MKLWSKLSKALLKSGKKINPGSSVLFVLSIISEIKLVCKGVSVPV